MAGKKKEAKEELKLPSKDEVAKIGVQDNEELGERKQFVIFQLAGEDYALPILNAKEIIRMTDVTRIPGTSDFILGVINLRGRIVVAIDLEKRLSIQAQDSTDRTRILISEVDDKMIGMKVDSVSEVLWIPVEDIKAAPKTLSKKIELSYLKGVGVIGDRLIIILDPEKMLTSEDKDAIHAIHSAYDKN